MSAAVLVDQRCFPFAPRGVHRAISFVSIQELSEEKRASNEEGAVAAAVRRQEVQRMRVEQESKLRREKEEQNAQRDKQMVLALEVSSFRCRRTEDRRAWGFDRGMVHESIPAYTLRAALSPA